MDSYNSETLYHIFHQVMRLHYHRIHMLLEEVGLYPGQPPMLLALYRKDGQSQKGLAIKLKISPATITVMVNRMEKAELVERRQDPKDQRVSRVFLSQKGKTLCQELLEIMKIINSECFNDFTGDERELLRKFLIKMRDNLSGACNRKGDVLL